MPRLNASLWINAAPEKVFRACQAPSAPLLPTGGPRLVIPDQPGKVGARYRWEFKRLGMSGQVDGVLTEVEPGRLLRFRSHSGWRMEADLLTEPENGGTRLTFHMKYRFGVPWRWIVPGDLIRLGVWYGLHQVKALTEKAPPKKAAGSIVM